MPIVTSAEAQKNFGRYREQALAEPVIVTQYGKPSVVMTSAAEYERLKELDRRVMGLDDMSDESKRCSTPRSRQNTGTASRTFRIDRLWRCQDTFSRDDRPVVVLVEPRSGSG